MTFEEKYPGTLGIFNGLVKEVDNYAAIGIDVPPME